MLTKDDIAVLRELLAEVLENNESGNFAYFNQILHNFDLRLDDIENKLDEIEGVVQDIFTIVEDLEQ
ncbi:MAG TPA: hypothetical protein VFD05_02975 [Bacilli bacterium]|nr:hypothetical protein [Bacilli bacterium]